MKIALTGAHGVGKTTLANELLRRLSGKGFGVVAVAPEVPREICSLAADREFFRRGKNNPLKQALLMYAQLQHEHFSLPQEDGVLICDRSVLDLWACSKYLFGDEFQDAGVRKLYEALVAQYCRSYRCHFYIPAEFPPPDDGVRESDSDFQASIDRTIREFLEKYAVAHRKTSGTLDERCAIVETELRAMASRPPPLS
ncbi:MAG TPA: ATP-binding protein [Patescibacteria group bacterium]|nr:ATP-binding protein [Patescibacteria group bacterium]